MAHGVGGGNRESGGIEGVWHYLKLAARRLSWRCASHRGSSRRSRIIKSCVRLEKSKY